MLGEQDDDDQHHCGAGQDQPARHGYGLRQATTGKIHRTMPGTGGLPAPVTEPP
jgi:hypothetical protein